jgi:hypothetical protein
MELSKQQLLTPKPHERIPSETYILVDSIVVLHPFIRLDITVWIMVELIMAGKCSDQLPDKTLKITSFAGSA